MCWLRFYSKFWSCSVLCLLRDGAGVLPTGVSTDSSPLNQFHFNSIAIQFQFNFSFTSTSISSSSGSSSSNISNLCVQTLRKHCCKHDIVTYLPWFCVINQLAEWVNYAAYYGICLTSAGSVWCANSHRMQMLLWAHKSALGNVPCVHWCLKYTPHYSKYW